MADIFNVAYDLILSISNKAPRRKQRGIKSALQTAGFQPAFAPRGEELNPEEIKIFPVFSKNSAKAYQPNFHVIVFTA